ncbi:hypothetical protein [Siphonobacter sp. SORGH_AS_1065]|nr:hypothetical protein [Siphonobacter sp. SORGH_AS_1065]MDQ1087815.1 hypothetical protein [Siphonobacter sp. SORGH_AS_1065]
MRLATVFNGKDVDGSRLLRRQNFNGINLSKKDAMNRVSLDVFFNDLIHQ